MKKVIFIFSLCAITIASKGQYQSFFGEKTTKYSIFLHHPTSIHKNDSVIYGALGGGRTYEFLISKKDTIMVGDTVYYQNNWDRLYIREDTSTGQIFRYIKEKKKEYLVCDMSLNVGDTFTFTDYDHSYGYYEEGKNIIVDSVSYVNGKKVIYFPYIDRNSMYYSFDSAYYYELLWVYGIDGMLYKLTFIEGIGPIYGPFGLISLGWGYLGLLLCVEKDDELIHITSPYLGCNQAGGASIAESETNPIRIYPNPAIENIHIEIENEALLYGTLRIIDPIGQIVLTRILTSNKEIIPIKHLSSGLYIIHYISNNQLFHFKFIKN